MPGQRFWTTNPARARPAPQSDGQNTFVPDATKVNETSASSSIPTASPGARGAQRCLLLTFAAAW